MFEKCPKKGLFEVIFKKVVPQIGIESEKRKKAIWMDCGIHAREWIAPAFCQYFVKQVKDPKALKRGE